VADIQRRSTAKGGVRWDVRYRDETMAQRKRSFARKVDAQRFASSVETDLLRGDWIDPKRGQEEFALWADKWLATIADRKPKTRESYESIVANDSSNRLRRPTSLERKVMIDAGPSGTSARTWPSASATASSVPMVEPAPVISPSPNKSAATAT